LAISKQLVELHGGTIHAVSGGIGQGATFVVRLPKQSGSKGVAFAQRATAEERPISPMAVPGEMLLEGLDILLVDDEQETLTMFGVSRSSRREGAGSDDGD
jgi:hypothetical protein